VAVIVDSIYSEEGQNGKIKNARKALWAWLRIFRDRGGQLWKEDKIIWWGE